MGGREGVAKMVGALVVGSRQDINSLRLDLTLSQYYESMVLSLITYKGEHMITPIQTLVDLKRAAVVGSRWQCGAGKNYVVTEVNGSRFSLERVEGATYYIVNVRTTKNLRFGGSFPSFQMIHPDGSVFKGFFKYR